MPKLASAPLRNSTVSENIHMNTTKTSSTNETVSKVSGPRRLFLLVWGKPAVGESGRRRSRDPWGSSKGSLQTEKNRSTSWKLWCLGDFWVIFDSIQIIQIIQYMANHIWNRDAYDPIPAGGWYFRDSDHASRDSTPANLNSLQSCNGDESIWLNRWGRKFHKVRGVLLFSHLCAENSGL